MLRHLKLKMNVKIKLMSFSGDDEKLLEKCKTIWTKIEGLKNTELNALPVSDDRYIKNQNKSIC